MRIIALFLVTVLFFACSEKLAIEKPDKLISEETMVDIIYDLSVLQAIRSVNPTKLEQKKLTPTSYVYLKYNIDSLQFAQNERYYASDIELYEKMYDKVNNRLVQKKKAIDDSKEAIKK